jgi:DNA invertase Pin-like site-specific DNA recombinase
MKVALYGRVSTNDKGQDPENQLTQLREWCADAGHTCVGEYIDYETGKKAERKEFNRLFEDAHKRRFELVGFWALDRFSREGMIPTILHLQRLAACGVGFHSFTEAHLATDNELVRNILLALLASSAKVEAQKISERPKAGMARARAKEENWKTCADARIATATSVEGCRSRSLCCREGAWSRSKDCDEIFNT